MAAFSDQAIDSITWKQVKMFAAAHDSSFWVSGGSWDYMDLASKRLFLADLELVCGVEFRLDTMTAVESIKSQEKENERAFPKWSRGQKW